MTKETLIYALRAGDTESYQEDLIATTCKTQEDIDKVKAAASADGWHSFRIAYFTPGEVPNFANTVDHIK